MSSELLQACRGMGYSPPYIDRGQILERQDRRPTIIYTKFSLLGPLLPRSSLRTVADLNILLIFAEVLQRSMKWS